MGRNKYEVHTSLEKVEVVADRVDVAPGGLEFRNATHIVAAFYEWKYFKLVEAAEAAEPARY